jgi:hypothetical protein
VGYSDVAPLEVFSEEVKAYLDVFGSFVEHWILGYFDARFIVFMQRNDRDWEL